MRPSLIFLILAFLVSAAGAQNVATSTPTRDKIFYVESYGAKAGTAQNPDTTDDRAAIQRAIDAAYTAGGGVVQLATGTYYVNENGSGLGLLLKTSVKLRGQPGTIITTDNRLATGNYCVIAPYGYNTATTPYSAHELDIEGIVFTCTTYCNTTAMTTAATYSGGTQTLITVGTSGDAAAGDTLTISGCSDGTYNATWTVQSVPSATTLAINKAWGSAPTNGSVAFAQSQKLHNHIGIAHTPKAVIRNCGFINAPFHYMEFNACKNVLVENCYAKAPGNCAGACLEWDNMGSCGVISGSAQYSTNIVSGGTYASNTQVLLTVGSTTGFSAGQWILITNATLGAAATYGAVGGYRICSIVSSTTMAIELGWNTGTPNVSATTTTGTVKQTIPVENVTVRGFDQSCGRTDKGLDPYGNIDFCYLSHTNHTGVYRNAVIEDCKIYPHDSNIAMAGGSTRSSVGFDSQGFPLEFDGLYIRRNRFVTGGQSGVTFVVWLGCSYSSTYPTRVFRNVFVEKNTFDCAALDMITVGDKSGGGDNTSVRTAIQSNAVDIALWKNYTVADNLIRPIWRTGGTNFARRTGGGNFGAAERAKIVNNRIEWPNVAPILNTAAFTASATCLGFLVDHVRDLEYTGNSSECLLTPGNVGMYCAGHVFGCSAFELNSGTLYKANWIYTNNSAVGTGAVDAGLTTGFVELLTPGTTGVSSWTSSTAPNVVGVWKGNRIRSDGASFVAHTGYGCTTHLATPMASLGTTVRTAAWCESPSGTNPGRHRWGYGPRTGTATLVAGVIAVSDTAITTNSVITVNRSTDGGTLGCSYSITRSVGVSFTITSKDSAGATQTADTSTLSYTINEPN